MAKHKTAKTKTSTLKAFWRLFKGFWTSESKWLALGMLALLFALCAVKVYCVYMIPQWSEGFEHMLRSKDPDALLQFIPSLKKLAMLLGGFALADGARIYVQQQLRLRWRVWMTDRLLTRWMSNKAYYRLQVMDSDAAIHQEIQERGRLVIQIIFDADWQQRSCQVRFQWRHHVQKGGLLIRKPVGKHHNLFRRRDHFVHLH